MINKTSSGVTLLELLIVIAIMGIMAAVLAPTLSNYVPGIQLNGSARVLSGNLRQAQEKAITEQKQYMIRFHPTNVPPSYEMIRINNGVEELQSSVTLASSETLSLATAIASTSNQIVFSPDGGPSASGDITLSINSVSKIINVSPAGFIKIN